MNLYTKALIFAVNAHCDQKRKYTNHPYITHPIAVAELLRLYGPRLEDFYNSELAAAALLHDVLEDTSITVGMIQNVFGVAITGLVMEVTDVSKLTDGNRAARKAIDRAHIARASYLGKAIKLADIIHNTSTIVTFDPVFANVYLPEKQALLEVLTNGPKQLYDMAYLNAVVPVL